MENRTNMSEEFRLAELKKDTLRRSFELVHAQANSILLFTLQWEDLEQHFDLVKKSLEKHSKEVDVNKKLIDQRAKEIGIKETDLGLVQTRIEECNRELESKEKQLGLMQTKIEECNGELVNREKQLGLCLAKIKACNSELESKEKQLDLVKKRFEECTCELQSRESELNLVRNSVEAGHKNLGLQKEVNLVEESIENCLGELKQLELMKNLINYYSEKLALKNMELSGIENSIEERKKEYLMKEQHVASFQRLIEDYAEELKVKEMLFNAIKKSIEDCDSELNSKKKELKLIETSIEKQSAELNSKEKKFESLRRHVRRCQKELESKGTELDSIKKELKIYYDDLELREREFNGIRKCIEERNQELTLKEEQLKLAQLSIEECNMEFEGTKEKIISIEKLTAEYSEELELKKNQLTLIQKSVKEFTDEHESEELQLDLIKGMSRGLLEELKEKENHFHLVGKTLEERLQDLALKERHFEERVKVLELKERQFASVQKEVESYSKNLELKEKQLSDLLSQVTTDLAANGPRSPLYPSLHSCILRDGTNLLLLLNHHLKKHDFVCGEISTALRTAHDPAKLVLDAIQGFYPPTDEGDMGFDASIIRRSCILLLDQLQIVSPRINPQVKNDAIKLAGEWKTKMRLAVENSLEVLGFLQLLAAFELGSAFDGNELQCLLDIVAKHRQTPKLRQALGISHKVPDIHILPSQVKTEPPECSPVNNPLHSLSASVEVGNVAEGRSSYLFLTEHMKKHDLMLDEVSTALNMSLDPAKFVLDLIQGSYSTNKKKQGMGFEIVVRNYIFLLEQLKKVLPKISPAVKAEAKKLAVEWKIKIGAANGNTLDVLGFLQFLAVYELVAYFDRIEIFELLRTIAQHNQAPEICQALGLTDIVPVLVSNLIAMKQYIEAVRFVCTFKLMGEFPPEVILREYLEYIKKSASSIFQEGNNSLDALDKAIDFELAALRTLTECIEDFKLENIFQYEDAKKCIAKLENQKAVWRHTATVPHPGVQLQLQNEKNQKEGTSIPTNQPAFGLMLQPQHSNKNLSIGAFDPWNHLQQKNHYKRPRIDPSIIGSYTSQGHS